MAILCLQRSRFRDVLCLLAAAAMCCMMSSTAAIKIEDPSAAGQQTTDEKIHTKPTKLFQYDGPQIFGIGMSPEIQRLIDDHNEKVNNLHALAQERSELRKEQLKLRSHENPMGGFLSPGKSSTRMSDLESQKAKKLSLIEGATEAVSSRSEDSGNNQLLAVEGFPEIAGVRAVPFGSSEDVISWGKEQVSKGTKELSRRQAQGPWYGGWWLAIFGLNFGESGNEVAAMVGSKPCIDTLWANENLVFCQVPKMDPAETDVSVVAHGKRANLRGAIAIEGPEITEIKPSNSPTVGGVFVTLSGKHFGFLDTSPNLALSSSGCQESHWIADSSMLCKILPGVGANLELNTELQHTAHIQEPPTQAFEYGKKAFDSRKTTVRVKVEETEQKKGDVALKDDL